MPPTPKISKGYRLCRRPQETGTSMAIYYATYFTYLLYLLTYLLYLLYLFYLLYLLIYVV